MTKYKHLLELKESGELKILMNEFGFPTHFLAWMEIYEFHLKHSKLSQFQVAKNFNISKAKVWEAYRFMNQRLSS